MPQFQNQHFYKDQDIHHLATHHLAEQDEEVHYLNCTFTGLELNGLNGTTFTKCCFVASSFASCTARSSRFEHCEFYDRDNETGTNFKFADLQDCTFDHCDMSLADFSRSKLYQTEFIGCQMTGANFLSATSCHTIGNSVELSSVTFTDCNFAYADLRNIRMPEADFSGSRMSHVHLDKADLTDAVLADCELHQVEAEGIMLRGADLRGATLSGLDVRQIDVTGVKIDALQAPIILESLGMIVT